MKSVHFFLSVDPIWCNSVTLSLWINQPDVLSSVLPLHQRAKLKNPANYAWFKDKIWKNPLLANKMHNLQTHFGFTNLWSKVPSFWVPSSQRVKNGTRTPCNGSKALCKQWCCQMKNDCKLRKFAEIKLMAESYVQRTWAWFPNSDLKQLKWVAHFSAFDRNIIV